jgi:hypothetical protein
LKDCHEHIPAQRQNWRHHLQSAAVKARGGGVYFVGYRTEYREKPPLGKQPALMMIDLLSTQDYIVEANLYEGQPLTCDLDRFRDKAVGIHIFNAIRAETDQIAGALFGGSSKSFGGGSFPECRWTSRNATGNAPACQATWI